MRTQWEVQLSCGNIQVVKNAWEVTHVVCTVHGMPDSIVAIETREWHIRCNDCRYAKWCGASLANIRIVERKHYVSKPNHTMGAPQFMTPDDVRERWRKVYGRKRTPRRYINPSDRRVTIRESITSAIAGKAREKREREDNSDIPPF
jgi:hypothetical protein